MKIFKPVIIISALILSFTMTSCFNTCLNCVQGSEKIVEEYRDVNQFNKIVLKGSSNIFVSQGNETKVKVVTDDNIIEQVTTEVSGSTLIISSVGSICPSRFDVYVTSPDYEGIMIKGSGDIVGETPIKTDLIALVIKGSGDIAMEIESEKLKGEILGSGDISVKGKAEKTKFEIKGSGDFKLTDFTTKISDIEIYGSGNCRLNVKEDLSVKIYGSGDVYYTGKPQNVYVDIKGSGDVHQAE